MFKLVIAVETDSEFDLHGLAALDRLRELGLPDAAEAIFQNQRDHPLYSSQDGAIVVGVDEHFARRHPLAFANSASAAMLIAMHHLSRGDAISENVGDVRLSPALTADRLIAIADDILD